VIIRYRPNRWRFTAGVAADGAVFAAELSLAACRNMTAVTAEQWLSIVPPLQAAETRNKLSWVPQPGFSCTWYITHKNPYMPDRRWGDASPHPPPGSATGSSVCRNLLLAPPDHWLLDGRPFTDSRHQAPTPEILSGCLWRCRRPDHVMNHVSHSNLSDDRFAPSVLLDINSLRRKEDKWREKAPAYNIIALHRMIVRWCIDQQLKNWHFVDFRKRILILYLILKLSEMLWHADELSFQTTILMKSYVQVPW